MSSTTLGFSSIGDLPSPPLLPPRVAGVAKLIDGHLEPAAIDEHQCVVPFPPPHRRVIDRVRPRSFHHVQRASWIPLKFVSPDSRYRGRRRDATGCSAVSCVGAVTTSGMLPCARLVGRPSRPVSSFGPESQGRPPTVSAAAVGQNWPIAFSSFFSLFSHLNFPKLISSS
jgi:hypothetical protein